MSLRLGDIAPDFTPVCTTELGFTAKLGDEFARRFSKGYRTVKPCLRLTPDQRN